MKAIIVGAGKVGYALAANLCSEGHEITVIDTNRKRLDVLDEHLNVNTIHGNGAKVDTLTNADVAHSDLVIAVTEKDELNLVTCFIAKNSGAGSTVARVRTPGYSDFDNSNRLEALGVDMIVNPERITAAEIKKLVEFPEANYVGYFGDGQIQMLELKLTANCTKLNIPLKDLNWPSTCVIVGIERDGKLLIPRGNEYLMAGDEILLLAKSKEIREIERFLTITVHKPHDIIIMGGGLSAYYLAEMLEKSSFSFNTKLLDRDSEHCEEMTSLLKDTVIIHTQGAEISIFEDENMADTDVFVAASEDDKENFFVSILAKQMGAKKTITQIRGGDYVHLIEKAGVDKVVSTNRLTTDNILRFINRTRILALTRFDDSLGQIAAYLVPNNSPAVGKSLPELDFPEKAIICMIIRGQHHLIPTGRDTIEAGDTVIVFSMPEALKKAERLLTNTIGD